MHEGVLASSSAWAHPGRVAALSSLAGPASTPKRCRVITPSNVTRTLRVLAKRNGDKLAGPSAVQTEFSTKLAPALSQQLQMTPEQFNGFVSEKFPAVAAGMGALPKAVPTFDGLINTLDEQRPLLVKGVDQAVERGNGLGQCAHASCDRRELLGDEPVELLRGHLELLAQGGRELGAELCLHRRKARELVPVAFRQYSECSCDVARGDHATPFRCRGRTRQRRECGNSARMSPC